MPETPETPDDVPPNMRAFTLVKQLMERLGPYPWRLFMKRDWVWFATLVREYPELKPLLELLEKYGEIVVMIGEPHR